MLEERINFYLKYLQLVNKNYNAVLVRGTGTGNTQDLVPFLFVFDARISYKKKYDQPLVRPNKYSWL
jgi:hypothetical protein